MSAAPSLRVTEIFASIQGESTRAGLPTVFVRLTGCPLRCAWCDTEYAFRGGTHMSEDDILAAIAAHGIPTVCITGGEPLAQRAVLGLMHRLCDMGYRVSIETCGALDIAEMDARVVRVLDWKAPSSGECDKNRLENLRHLRAHDEIKFVLANETDYRWACAQIRQHRLSERCTLLFSPVAGHLSPAALAEWIVRDRLPVRFQLQLHKVLWQDARGK